MVTSSAPSYVCTATFRRLLRPPQPDSECAPSSGLPTGFQTNWERSTDSLTVFNPESPNKVSKERPESLPLPEDFELNKTPSELRGIRFEKPSEDGIVEDDGFTSEPDDEGTLPYDSDWENGDSFDPLELPHIDPDLSTVRETTAPRVIIPRAHALPGIESKLFSVVTTTIVETVSELATAMGETADHPEFPTFAHWWDVRFNGGRVTDAAEAIGVERSTLSKRFDTIDELLEDYVKDRTNIQAMYPHLDLRIANTRWVAVVTRNGKDSVVDLGAALSTPTEIMDALDAARDKAILKSAQNIRAKKLSKVATVREIEDAKERITDAFQTAPISGPDKLIGGLTAISEREKQIA